MLGKMALEYKGIYFKYSVYLLCVSIFLGNAALSIVTAGFYVNLFFLSYNRSDIYSFFSRKTLVLLGLYFFIIITILFLVLDDYEDLVPIKDYFPFLLFPVIIFSFQKIVKDTKFNYNVRKVYVLSALSSFIISFFYGLWRTFFFEKNFNPIYLSYKFLSEPFGVHHIYMSIFYILAILFCIDLLILKRHKVSPKMYLISAFVLFFGVVLLSSRTAIFGGAIVFLLKVWYLKVFRIKTIIVCISSLLLIGLTLTVSIPTLGKRAFNINQNISSYSGASFRMKIWDNALELFKNSPIYGYGIKKSQKELEGQYKKVNFRRAYLGNFNVHNQYIQSLIDSGITGLVVLLIMLFSPFLCEEKNINVRLFSLLVIICSITESFLVRQNGIVFYCLFLSIFIVEYLKE
ncbi:O-antigen ligase family protein [Hyunsoonleella flava]|uniref:O-antigen ligase family protein n=1 Tax=Hyunsoonleella flava TaxID=2527939 RepID=A0A4Q9FBM3_9FLAO|nr:O-antigen ligase family protein [Hyunsoonleella flava]TBN00177.1 O-antigen ligase family protein [Hyunsoonleella flava]